jgi:hypothetical protein
MVIMRMRQSKAHARRDPSGGGAGSFFRTRPGIPTDRAIVLRKITGDRVVLAGTRVVVVLRPTRGGPRYRIGISGSYGGLNLGDEAILQSIVAQLRASVPCEITVFSRDAKDTAARHQVERSIPVRDLSRDEVRREVAELDC